MVLNLPLLKDILLRKITKILKCKNIKLKSPVKPKNTLKITSCLKNTFRPRNNESILKQLDRIEKDLNEKKPVIQNDTTLDSTHREESHSWKIDMADITNLQPVGEGAWGKVYKAKWHGPVAVKKLKCQDPTKDQIEGFRQEVKMLRKCRHENIVLFMSYILDPPKHMCIVMHWCASSLYKLLGGLLFS